MKKNKFIIIFLGFVFLLSTTLAFAQGYIDPLNKGEMASPVTQSSQLWDIFVTVVKWMYTIFFVVALMFILFSAYNFVSGGGSDDKIKLAKNQLKYAIIAIAVALVATGVSLVVQSFINSSVTAGIFRIFV